MKFSISKLSRLVGVLFSAPKPTLEYVNDLVKRANRGDEDSALTLCKIALKDSPAYVKAVAASTIIGSGENGVVTVTADAAWEVGNDLTIQVAVSAGENEALSATLTGNDILVTLGTGVVAGTVDDAKNTATLVKNAINAIEGKTFTAVVSGTGATAITTAVDKKSFAGGVDGVVSDEKVAWDIASEAIKDLFE